MCGRLGDSRPLTKEYEGERSKKGVLSKMTSRLVKAQVACRIVPIDREEAKHESLSLLPENFVGDIHTSMMVACYRAVLAAQLARVPTYMSAISDPVVAAFPVIMDDPPLRVQMHRLWQKHISTAPSMKIQKLVEVFRQVVTLLWPGLHAQAIPPSSIMNFNFHQSQRLSQLSEFTDSHPVVTLSHSAYNWLHTPLDVAELSFSYSDSLGPSV